MNKITTVTGSLTADALGFCQCHEHLLIRKGESYKRNPSLCIDDVNKTIEEVAAFHLAGGNTIIDAQPCGCGRMAKELRQISKQTHINIIASTGFHKLCFYPSTHWIHTVTEHELETIFTYELTNGMYIDADQHFPECSCRAKAGIIKTAFDAEELTSRYQTLFSSAISSALLTRCCISVHIEQGTNPMLLLKFMTDRDFPLSRLMLCHMDRACYDINLHKRIAGMGVYLEYDTIGRFKYHSNVHELHLMKEMIDSGYEKQLLFSLDTTRERLKSYNPQAVGLDYILTAFLPLMKTAGITPSQLKHIYNENCIRLLTN